MFGAPSVGRTGTRKPPMWRAGNLATQTAQSKVNCQVCSKDNTPNPSGCVTNIMSTTLVNYRLKRVDPYLWTELAPVLEGSVSRRRHPRKGTSVERIFVSYSLHVSIVGLFTLRQQRILGGSTFAEGNSEPMKRHLLLTRTPNFCISVTHG